MMNKTFYTIFSVLVSVAVFKPSKIGLLIKFFKQCLHHFLSQCDCGRLQTLNHKTMSYCVAATGHDQQTFLTFSLSLMLGLWFSYSTNFFTMNKCFYTISLFCWHCLGSNTKATMSYCVAATANDQQADIFLCRSKFL